MIQGHNLSHLWPARRPEVAEELSAGLVREHHVEEVLVLVEPQQLDEERVLQIKIALSRKRSLNVREFIVPVLGLML